MALNRRSEEWIKFFVATVKSQQVFRRELFVK